MIDNSKKFFGVNIDVKTNRILSKELGNKISRAGVGFLIKLLEVNPKKRISAQEALKFNYLKKSFNTNFSSLFSRGRLTKIESKITSISRSRKELKTSNSGNRKNENSFTSLISDHNLSSNKSILSSHKVLQASNKLPRIFIPSLDIKRRTFQEKFGKSTLKDVISNSQEKEFKKGNLSDRSSRNNPRVISSQQYYPKRNQDSGSLGKKETYNSKISSLLQETKQNSRETLRRTLMSNCKGKQEFPKLVKNEERIGHHKKNNSCQIGSSNFVIFQLTKPFIKKKEQKITPTIQKKKINLNFQLKITSHFELPSFN